MLLQSFYKRPATELAPLLLGCELVHESAEGTTSGIIVETEAYHQLDPASHTFRGPTLRNAPMFGPPGHVYIYFTYGMHYCINIVGGDHSGEAVLIRALEPKQGIELMQRRRQTNDSYNLCSGPAKLVQAMGILPAQNGAKLDGPLSIKARKTEPIIATTPRIGIKRAAGAQLRFIIVGQRFICSSKFNKAAVPLEV